MNNVYTLLQPTRWDKGYATVLDEDWTLKTAIFQLSIIVMEGVETNNLDPGLVCAEYMCCTIKQANMDLRKKECKNSIHTV